MIFWTPTAFTCAPRISRKASMSPSSIASVKACRIWSRSFKNLLGSCGNLSTLFIKRSECWRKTGLWVFSTRELIIQFPHTESRGVSTPTRPTITRLSQTLMTFLRNAVSVDRDENASIYSSWHVFVTVFSEGGCFIFNFKIWLCQLFQIRKRFWSFHRGRITRKSKQHRRYTN